MRGKIIVIEGTDCSGKETQTKKLVERLKKEGKSVFCMSFPQYETPTGRIVGGPYLGKDYICKGWFPETAPNVDPLVSSCYYAADRRYHKDTIIKHLEKGEIVFLDRYTTSNMAHQGSKYNTKEEKITLFNKIMALEFDILELPKPDATFFLYMPPEQAIKLRESRATNESLDENESNLDHLKKAEETYLLMSELYGFKKINCIKDGKIRSIEDIHEEIYESVCKMIEKM